MKITKIVLALCATATIFFTGCKNDNSTLLLGTFSQTTLSQTDLYEKDVPDSPVIISCTVKNTTALNFTENGEYSLSINQNVNDIELYDLDTFTLGDINSYFYRNLTINGKYKATKNKLTLTNETVLLDDGQIMDFKEYQATDSAVGPEIQNVKYSVNEKELSLYSGGNSITYTRK